MQGPALFSSGYLQDVRYRSLGNQAVRTQKVSDQAVRTLLSLKPHYKLFSVNNNLTGIECFLHNCTSLLLLGPLGGYGCNTLNVQLLQSPHQWPSKAETLLFYRARIYQQASISAARGVPVPFTSKANFPAWELLIFNPLCASSALSFQVISLLRKWLCRPCLYLFQNAFSHHLGCPCLQQYFWHPFKS